MQKETKVDRFFSVAKNHPILSVLIIICVIVVGLADFTDSLSRLASLFPFWPEAKELTPGVAITSIADGQVIGVKRTANGGHFRITGNSANVSTQDSLRIVVLVHPSIPFSKGWWVQETNAITDDWSTEVWLGNKDYPPEIANEYDIVALAISDKSVVSGMHVIQPGDLKPSAMSQKRSFSIGQLIPE